MRYTPAQLALMLLVAAILGAAWLVARHFDDNTPAT